MMVHMDILSPWSENSRNDDFLGITELQQLLNILCLWYMCEKMDVMQTEATISTEALNLILAPLLLTFHFLHSQIGAVELYCYACCIHICIEIPVGGLGGGVGFLSTSSA